MAYSVKLVLQSKQKIENHLNSGMLVLVSSWVENFFVPDEITCRRYCVEEDVEADPKSTKTIK
jgi:hypothetical protein